jgi:hypothetical protein
VSGLRFSPIRACPMASFTGSYASSISIPFMSPVTPGSLA